MPGSGTCVIVHDPWRPAPAVGGHLSPTAGPCDRRVVDQRSDVAVFSSAPLQTALQLCGRPLLKLKVSADQPAFDLCAALSRLPADRDEVQQLSTGVLRVRRVHGLGIRPDHAGTAAAVRELPTWRSTKALACGGLMASHWRQSRRWEQRFGPPNSDCRVITLCLQLDEATLQMAPLLVPQAG